ncbi:MAG: phytoene desaturase [Pseudohongiellaceae bacterium]|jgi:phytoene desaturase
MNRAIVIGGGFGGIAGALRLRAKGYEVSIIDRCPKLGGRAQVFEREGFRFDAGPTVLTAPFLFDELFQLFDRRREDYVDFVPVNPWYRFQFPDGETFDYGGTLEDTLAEIERFNHADKKGYEALVKQSERIFDVGFTKLADQPFHSFTTMLKQIPSLLRLKCYRTVWQLVKAHIKDPRLRQAFSVQPLLVGGSPFDTTSIYGLIHFLERRWGIHFAMGGTGALVDGLQKLMQENNIDIQLNTTVKRIVVEDKRATGVELENGEILAADVVVSNVDPVHLYRHMLDKDHQAMSARLKQRHARLSMGLFVLFFGTDKQYPDVAHHTIWLGRRYQELLKDIFHGSELPEDFSLYLHRPTATDPSFAPAGKDSFYVLAPVPNLQAGIDWEQEGPRLQERIVKALSDSILPDLKKHMVADFYMTPENFAQDYLSEGGAGFSVAPLFSQSAWFRFHNRAEGPENLYLVGAGTHPGAGLPGVLSSAKVLDRLIPEPDLQAQPLAV